MTNTKLPMLGRKYRYVYGYPWRYAILAELAWRIEHVPWRDEGQPFAKLAGWGYMRRKGFEQRGAPLLGPSASSSVPPYRSRS
jgi:hypothetical protein